MHKKQILPIAALFAAFFLLAFTGINYQPKATTAEVNTVEGLYIFTDSKPVLEHETLGTVKIGGGLGGFHDTQYEGVRDKLIKKAKKEFPEGNGLILSLRSGSADKADVIRIANP